METFTDLDHEQYLRNIPRGYVTYILGVAFLYLLYRVCGLVGPAVTVILCTDVCTLCSGRYLRIFRI